MATPSVRAFGYADDISAGKRDACKWVRLAVDRHTRDLARQDDPQYPYRFDAAAADKAARFIELMPHTKGKWAARNERLALEPWQCFLVCSIFGWRRKADSKRRFRRALLLVPRKNGKSALAAAIGLYMLTADGEHGAEVYSGATTEKQAWEVFRPARLMALQQQAMRDHYGVHVNASNIAVARNASRFEPVIGKPGDGASPSCAITDEYHEHATDEQLETMETGMGAREQPLSLIITTAGDNIAGPCYALQQDCQRMLEGVIDKDDTFALLYGIDAGDDWTTEAALRKANPNYGVSVDGEFLASRQAEAIGSARKQGVFRCKHLNEWVGARDAYYNVQRWLACEQPGLTLEDMEGRECYLGMDLASKVDIAALELLFPLPGGEFVRFGRYYLPSATVDAGENEHYQGWAREGRITVTDGEIIDFDEIRADILDLCSRFTVREVAYDPHQATMLVTSLAAEGVPCVEMRPTVLNFSEPMKMLDGLIRAGNIKHDGDPVMSWMIGNVTAKMDAKDNVYPRKERPENKIDGVVALIMALGRALVHEDDRLVMSVPSDYEVMTV